MWDVLTTDLSQYEDDSYFEEFADECEKFSLQWLSMYGKFKSLISSQIIDQKPTVSTSYQPTTPYFSKLPEPKIPPFDGNKIHWLEFKETFKALVHDNPNIPDVIKLTYLLDKLKGKAKESVGFVSYTTEGYKNAWKSLCNDYDDERSLVDVHIKGIMDLPRVSKDNINELTDLINLLNSHISSLASVDYHIDKLSEMLLINIVLNKLNSNLRMEFEKEISSNSIPKWDEFIEFLRKQNRILQRANPDGKRLSTFTPSNRNSKSGNAKPQSTNQGLSSTFLSNNQAKSKHTSSSKSDVGNQPFQCPICLNVHHWLHMCPKFLEMNTHQRFEKVKEFRLCINCLKSKDHGSKVCSHQGCKICSNKHHTLLHHVDYKPKPADNLDTSSKLESAGVPTPSTSQNFYSNTKNVTKQIVLSTALVLVRNSRGRYIECRALLDNASTSNYVTKSLANRLQIPRERVHSSSFGLNNTKTDITEKISANIKSRTSSFERELEFLIVPTISDNLPQSSFNITRWDIPQNITLADTTFHMSRPVDMLIGGETFFELLQSGKIILKDNYPHLQQSVFGWVCVGVLKEEHSLNFHLSHNSPSSNDNLSLSLKELFDIDHVPDQNFLSNDAKFCESNFEKTTSRDETGRYIVSLPLKPNVVELGESKHQAINRFLKLEKRLDMDPDFKAEYSNVINDYSTQGHMKPIPDSDENGSNKESPMVYYLPHHAVVKLSSSTTKVRVVFDASSKTTTNLSLNDVMFVGPTIQQTSFEILLRFRKHKFVFTSDINKMYRQVKIDPNQTSLQRILWRQNKTDPIQTFELQTVTFGTAAAPYLATRALKQLAVDEGDDFGLASDVVLKDFYVDDVLSGSDDLNQTIEIQQQLTTLLSRGGFKLHKWSANHKDILRNVPTEDREILQPDQSSSDECLKTLGLIWLPEQDVFKFRVPLIEQPNTVTKRSILSDIARLYDPLGLLAPIIIVAKIFVQSLWKCQLEWDDIVPPDLSEKWISYQTELSSIEHLKLDRRTIIDQPTIVQLHGFADASEKAYGACVYIRSFDQHHNCSVKLVCSKTRVAPIKTISLPRLELCGALLLSRLINTVIKSVDIKFENVYLWSDSTVTLAWINTPPYKLKTFVANRVNEIQESTVNYMWNHVESSQNAADIITRGISPSELHNLKNWWNGPDFLNSSIVSFVPNHSHFVIDNPDDQSYELKTEHVSMVTVNCNDFNLIERYSSYDKLLRVVSYCRRFIHNCRNPNDRKSGNLNIDELDQSLTSIAKVVQMKSFKTEISYLKENKPIPRNSPILSLNPFLDKNEVLRVGGRLNNSDYNYDIKHQILIPSDSYFATLMTRYYHEKHMHAGPNLLVSFTRQKFWVTSAKNLANKIYRSCVICFKVKPRVMSQIMGDLPSARTTPARAFETTGVDLCGPFLIKGEHRNSSHRKVYVAVFVCFITKGLHLEILSDLSTKCFLRCLQRFISRRGSPVTIWSDNAKNFVGARNELRRWHLMFKDKNEFKPIDNLCKSEGIDWKFIPPRAPNFGGLWESAVKSLKFHLKRVASKGYLYYEEFQTLITQIEGILNSRPISILSSDPSDPTPLTPGHFLTGGPIVAPPEPSYLSKPETDLTRWQRVSQMTQSFWNRFSVEHVHSFQVRTKWKSPGPDLKSDDIVLVSDENLPPTQWMLGIVLELYEGKDKHSRVALIRTKAGNFKRSISKLCKLPIEQ